MRVVPELYCQSIKDNITFFVDVLGFAIKYQREEEEFVYLTREGVDLMLEGVDLMLEGVDLMLEGVDLMLEGVGGDSRKWLTGNLEYPFGRGVNFQWDVSDINALYSTVQSKAPSSIFLPMESKSYSVDGKTVTQAQFIVESPDGYLFRFCEDERQ
ncbi:VOC family protein [Vibrio sp. La 4.2.2]|uniref:VOC family protein n=1 Tax=Vibrio sp. La 4.2.2 TaxID=2998830 RepID=UPI0022CE2484|nr:VOC family protein [Vibrio sp. La 4.2.2]MDA0107692.1 VOC family protein [Vibrio sp. La 4.2.2]